MNKTAQAAFCPECASPLVDFSELSDEGARCNACGWSGRKSELLSSQFMHEEGGPGEVYGHFVSDLRLLMSKTIATPFAHFLLKWGFLPSENQKEQMTILARYLTVVARAIAV